MTSKKQSLESMDALGRSIEKHLSREFDQFYIEQGLASEHSIAIKNDFFRSLDLRRFSISAIGGRHTHGSECEVNDKPDHLTEEE
ncbi:hypothetical protein ACVSQB_37670 [Bradyrhizobium elkanii]